MRTVRLSRSFGQDDLAGEARCARQAGGEVEHVVFVVAGGRQAVEILRGDDDVAGRAGHRAFAAALERLAGGLRDLEQARTGRRIDFAVETAVGLEKANAGHAGSTLCARAASSIRWTAVASPSSPT